MPFKMFSLRLLYRTTPTCRWKMKPSLLAKVTIFSPVMMRESASPRDMSSHRCIPPPVIRMNHLSLKVLPARKETAPGRLSGRLQNRHLSPKTWTLKRCEVPKGWIARSSLAHPSFPSPTPLSHVFETFCSSAARVRISDPRPNVERKMCCSLVYLNLQAPCGLRVKIDRLVNCALRLVNRSRHLEVSLINF